MAFKESDLEDLYQAPQFATLIARKTSDGRTLIAGMLGGDQTVGDNDKDEIWIVELILLRRVVNEIPSKFNGYRIDQLLTTSFDWDNLEEAIPE